MFKLFVPHIFGSHIFGVLSKYGWTGIHRRKHFFYSVFKYLCYQSRKHTKVGWFPIHTMSSLESIPVSLLMLTNFFIHTSTFIQEILDIFYIYNFLSFWSTFLQSTTKISINLQELTTLTISNVQIYSFYLSLVYNLQLNFSKSRSTNLQLFSKNECRFGKTGKNIRKYSQSVV